MSLQLLVPRPERDHVNLFLSSRFLSARTARNYTSILEGFLDFSGWPPTPGAIKEFLDKARRRGLTDSTVLTYYQVIKNFCSWLVEAGHLPANPCTGLKPPPRPVTVPRAPRSEYIRSLFEYLEKEVEKNLRLGFLKRRWILARDLAIFSLIFDTGLRVGEVENLIVSDIDLDEMSVFVRQSKTRSQRTVYFASTARGDLGLWLDLRQELGVDVPYLFVKRAGGRWGRLTHWAIRAQLKRLCKRLGIEEFTPHPLRHAYAGHTLRNGGDLEQIQRQLGHKSSVMTMRYAQMIDEGRRNLARDSSPRDKL